MSLNRILWNDDLSGSSSEKINVDDLNIGGTLYYKANGYTQTGDFLTAYAPGRATFLSLPRLSAYRFGLVGIEPDTYDNGNFSLTFNEDLECVDRGAIITSRSGNDQSIRIDQTGQYYISYKITRISNVASIKTSLTIGGNLIPGSEGSLPFNSNSTSDQSISVSVLVSIPAGELLKLNITVYTNPVSANPFTLKPNSPDAVGFVKAELSPSFISIIKVSV